MTDLTPFPSQKYLFQILKYLHTKHSHRYNICISFCHFVSQSFENALSQYTIQQRTFN